MFSKRKVKPTAFSAVNALPGLQHAGLQHVERKGSPTTETSDVHYICPIHGEVKTRRTILRDQKQAGPLERIKTFFGKSDLEHKLAKHGIKAKVNKATIRQLHNTSKQSDLLTADELHALSIDKLRELQKAFDRKISSLNADMKKSLEEKQVMAVKNKKLKRESRDLEEKVKKMLRPWVNRYPHSDDLTRAYLIN